jgi:mitotic spindle assembly checkpoint protein MAD2B
MSSAYERDKRNPRTATGKNNIEYVLAAGLETWAHQVLYSRRVYPKATFGNVRFAGIQCRVNRHPDVVQYIQETVSLAAPAIIQGSVDQVSLIITCYENWSQEGLDETVEECKKLEECQIRFGNVQKDRIEMTTNNGDAELKQCFRELILRLGSLESVSSNFQNARGLSFRLELGISTQSTDSVPASLLTALSEGHCLESSNDWATKGADKGVVVRPLCQSNLSFGKVNLFHRRIQQAQATHDRQSLFVKDTST